MDGFTHIEGPTLKNKRAMHACGLMSNGNKSIIVAAGGSQELGPRGLELSTVEFFDPDDCNWIPGKLIQIIRNQMKHKIHAS